MKKLLIVVDMQNAVFDGNPRYDREGVTGRINVLARAADAVIFIRHEEEGMMPGSDGWQILPELHQPAGSYYVGKTACDAFYRTGLDDLLGQLRPQRLTLCGCATDYCLDTTIKNAASRGYALTVAADAHTTANRGELRAPQLIAHYNDVWANLIIPGNEIDVKSTEHILAAWR